MGKNKKVKKKGEKVAGKNGSRGKIGI